MTTLPSDSNLGHGQKAERQDREKGKGGDYRPAGEKKTSEPEIQGSDQKGQGKVG